MSRGKLPRPPWIDTSRKRLAAIRGNLNNIRAEGYKEIRRGVEKVRAAQRLDQDAAYMQLVLSHEPDDVSLSDEIVQSTGTKLGITILALDQDTDRLSSAAVIAGVASQEAHDTFISAVSSSDAPSASGVFLAAALNTHFYTIEPELSGAAPPAPPPRSPSAQEVLGQLRSILASIDPRFVDMLDGSEAALGAPTPDHLSQAAHSMRDLYQQVIQLLAPAQAVIQQPWFEPTPEAPDGVSRRSRIRFILQGPVPETDDLLITRLDEAAGNAKDMLDLCIARAHDHDPTLTPQEARLAIEQGRYSLFMVLTKRHQ